MSDIINLPPRPPRPPKPLAQAAEDALHLIRLAHSDLLSLAQRGRVKSVCAIVGIAAKDLERAIEAHSEGAVRDLREIVLTALGPDLKYGDVIAAKRALEMVLQCLDLPEPGAGGAA